VTMRLSGTVMEIWRPKCWTHGRGHKKRRKKGKRKRKEKRKKKRKVEGEKEGKGEGEGDGMLCIAFDRQKIRATPTVADSFAAADDALWSAGLRVLSLTGSRQEPHVTSPSTR